MDTMDARNRRLSERVPLAVKIRFKLIGGPESAKAHDYYVEAVTRNISEGGVFIELGKQSRLKDDAIGNFMLYKSTLDMEIALQGSGRPIRAQGRSVWIEKKVPGQDSKYARAVAVQFTKISPEDQAAIRNFVAQVSQG